MSRSYKKYPQYTDAGPHNYGKKCASKAVRAREREMLDQYEKGDVFRAESLELDNGGEYKNVFETYDIRDFSFVIFDPMHTSLDSEYLRKGLMK